MANKCQITNKQTVVGGGYSNATRATEFNPTGRRKRKVNMQSKKIFVPELNKSVKINVSTKGLRTISKNGAYKTLKKAKLI